MYFDYLNYFSSKVLYKLDIDQLNFRIDKFFLHSNYSIKLILPKAFK
jgi:hypothetical protein